jgi:hypothetical protein
MVVPVFITLISVLGIVGGILLVAGLIAMTKSGYSK